MTLLLLVALPCIIFLFIFAYALCRAASHGDELVAKARRPEEWLSDEDAEFRWPRRNHWEDAA